MTGPDVFRGRGIDAWPQSADSATAWTRFQWRYWRPTLNAAAGFLDYFRTQVTGQTGFTTLSPQGPGGDFTYPLDVATQRQYTRVNPVGGTSYAILLVDPSIAAAYPLDPSGVVEPTYSALIVSRKILRWGAGVVGATAGTVDGFFFYSAGSGFYSYVNPASTNFYCGIVRTSTGVFWGYCNGASPVLTALPSFDPFSWATVEHRFYPATATRSARYELRINDALIGTVDFAIANTPRYNFTSDRGVIPGFVMGCPAAGNPAFHFSTWDVGMGPDADSTLSP